MTLAIVYRLHLLITGNLKERILVFSGPRTIKFNVIPDYIHINSDIVALDALPIEDWSKVTYPKLKMAEKAGYAHYLFTDDHLGDKRIIKGSNVYLLEDNRS